METRKYIVPLVPVPWKRPGYRKDLRIIWDRQKQLKQTYRTILEEQCTDLDPFCHACELKLIFYLPIPKKSRPKQGVSVLHGRYHHYRPDLSNLIKFVEDAAIGILYTDDSLIASCRAEKRYDENPRTEIYLLPL